MPIDGCSLTGAAGAVVRVFSAASTTPRSARVCSSAAVMSSDSTAVVLVVARAPARACSCRSRWARWRAVSRGPEIDNNHYYYVR